MIFVLKKVVHAQSEIFQAEFPEVFACNREGIEIVLFQIPSEPAALLISPLLFAGAKDFKPAKVDLDGARRLLAEAGYPQGFGVGLDCPNDRYVNDEAICQALVGMLARIGVRVSLNAQPKAKFFAKVLAGGGYDTTFYLLGWTPNSFDSWNVFATLLACRDDKGTRGPFNLGGYCNPALDALAARILVETDTP